MKKYPKATDPLTEKLAMTAKKQAALAEIQRQEIIDIIKAPRESKSADDIISMLRSRNDENQQISFSGVINDLTDLIDQVVFAQEHLHYEDYQDITWHLDMLKNRLDWLIERRNELNSI
jgi:hypothetical protein